MYRSGRQMNSVSVEYQRLSQDRVASVTLDNTSSVRDVIAAISRRSGVHASCIDVVTVDTTVDSDQLLSTLDMPLQVVFHNSNRIVPCWKKTSEQDMINLDMEDGERLLMSCGHAITPENLYQYCWQKLSQGFYSIQCPALLNSERLMIRNVCTCGQIWYFAEISDNACLSDDERILFERKLNSNFVNRDKDLRECIECKILCSRLAEGNPRVVCRQCTTEFCWHCLLPWNRNHVCSRETIRDLLRMCKRKNIYDAKEVPAIRACVSCGTLLEHASGCKQMTCKCGFIFCFVCLRPCRNGGFTCKGKCRVAEPQIIN